MEHPYPIRPAEQTAFPSHVQWSGSNPLFTPAECESIIRLGESLPLAYATIGNGANNVAVLNKEYRSVKGAPLWRTKPGDNTWIYERLATRADWANREHYRFDLTGLGEPPQFLKYEASDEVPGHYDWHQDFGGGYSANRKLSVVVNLSDPRDYDGCRLRVQTEKEWEVPYINQGDAVMFPTWTPHCVTPITRGVRYALALWVHGPQFR